MFGYDWPRLHAALNDLPVALLLAAVLFDLLAALTKRASFRQVGFWTMLVGAVGGAIAVLSGLQAEEHIAHGEAVHQVMEVHEELGLITLGIFGFLTLWRIVRERRMGSRERGLSLLLSVGGLGVLVATGVYGGKLVFDHAAGIRSEVLKAELQERSEDHHHHGGASEPGAAPDSSMTAPPAGEHTDSPGAPPHTHAPGTPPHKD